MQVDLNEHIGAMSGSAFACIRNEQQARIAADIRRDWDRHPELRAQYENNFHRYLAACREWTRL